MTMQSSHKSDLSRQLVQSQLEHVRHWLVHCGEYVGAMLSAKDTAASSPDASEDESLNLVSNFESFLVELQSLLIWENPFHSAFALTTFTFFYWLIVLWSPRIFSIIAIIFFCYHFYEMWTRYVWPEIRVPTTEIKENWTSINPNVLSAPEIQTYLEKLKKSLLVIFCEIAELRRRSHGTFCFLSISLLLVFYYLGRNIPGVILVYSFAILIFLTPGFLLYVLPNHILDAIVDYFDSSVSPTASQEKDKINIEKSDLNQDQNIQESTTELNSESCSHSFSNKLYDKSSTSSEDTSDDFEIISENEFGEIDFK